MTQVSKPGFLAAAARKKQEADAAKDALTAGHQVVTDALGVIAPALIGLAEDRRDGGHFQLHMSQDKPEQTMYYHVDHMFNVLSVSVSAQTRKPNLLEVFGGAADRDQARPYYSGVRKQMRNGYTYNKHITTDDVEKLREWVVEQAAYIAPRRIDEIHQALESAAAGLPAPPPPAKTQVADITADADQKVKIPVIR